MATITPTSTINPTTMAANWSTGVRNNAQKWLNKYLNPRAAFNANPTQSQAAWQAGVTRAISLGTYATKLGAADLTAAANNASSFGVVNYGNSGTTKAASARDRPRDAQCDPAGPYRSHGRPGHRDGRLQRQNLITQ